jgi:hypothetical protein
MRIGIHKDEPIAARGGGPAISGPGDLVEGLEDDFCAGGAGDFGRFVRRIIVADDEFSFPAPLMEAGKGGVDVPQSFAEAALLVEGWDDRRDFQVSLSENMPEMAQERKSET